MSIFDTHLGLVDWRQETRLGGVSSTTLTLGTVLSIASIAASAYHGSKRHGGSVGWGVGWGILGGLFPLLTPAIGVAQGFGVCHYDCRR